MKLAHKELVRIVYPKAICVHLPDKNGTQWKGGYAVLDVVHNRTLGRAPSAWGAWFDAYKNFSKSQKKKAFLAGVK